MLTKLVARRFNSDEATIDMAMDPLICNLDENIFSDLIQIRKIDGLGPVKANINTTSFGNIDGSFLTSKNVDNRNIVITFGLNPDWATVNPETLRKTLNLYFMSKKPVHLEFSTDEYSDVQIDGYVESNEPDIFSKDLQIVVSIICPYPYFEAIAQQSLLINPDPGTPHNITYNGTVEVGFQWDQLYVSGGNPTQTVFHFNDGGTFQINDGVSPTEYLRLLTFPGSRHLYLVGGTADRYDLIEPGSKWPMLFPGFNQIWIETNAGVQQWQMTWRELYGGL